MLIALMCVALLAWANGANDNFKGVATLFGSGVTDYRSALHWATAATLAGSIAATWLTAHLVAAFSGSTMPNSLSRPRMRLISAVRCST